MRALFFSLFVFLSTQVLIGQSNIQIDKGGRTFLILNGEKIVCSPQEGLWSVSTKWENDWPCSWKHVQPHTITKEGEWTILLGEMAFSQGKLLLRDSYKPLKNGLIQCKRRYEWLGKESLRHVTLAIRWQVTGNKLSPFLPGILYYGNKMGAKMNPNIIPVYDVTREKDFAIFEEHRYPMPFAMLEDSQNLFGVALHVTPSPIRGAVLQDQWWSLGVENINRDTTELVMYSGPIGYNR